jgi:parvulin-like peptidyl-prolyl isomerase
MKTVTDHAAAVIRDTTILVAVCAGAVLAVPRHAVSAQDLPQADDRVAATVDGEPIYMREIERELSRVVGQRKVEPAALDALRSKTLEQLVDRRLVLKYLAEKDVGASEKEIDLEIRRIGKQLAQQEVAVADYVKRAGMSTEEFRRMLAWQIGWRRYLERFVTDQNLERYFDKHRRDFDGTQLRVAHILFQVRPRGDEQALSEAIGRAERVQREIQSGELAFADAAKQYSQAPTADSGGDIGYIARHQPMPEPFSRAAFALDKGQISPPVVSPAGVHLIQCLEIKPGEKTWQQSRIELEKAVTQYLFQWVADQQRPGAVIEIK